MQFVYQEVLGGRFEVRVFGDLASFRVAIGNTGLPRPELVVADLRLPDGSFLDFLSSRDFKEAPRFPFVIVSSLDDLEALRHCFREGARDYITKPFGKNELIAKVEKAMFPHMEAAPSEEAFALNLVSLCASRKGLTTVPLTTKEFQILTLFQQAPGLTMPRDELLI